jgi:glycerol kinase
VTGFFGDAATLAKAWVPARAFEPNMTEAEREARYEGWLDAVDRARTGGAR